MPPDGRRFLSRPSGASWSGSIIRRNDMTPESGRDFVRYNSQLMMHGTALMFVSSDVLTSVIIWKFAKAVFENEHLWRFCCSFAPSLLCTAHFHGLSNKPAKLLLNVLPYVNIFITELLQLAKKHPPDGITWLFVRDNSIYNISRYTSSDGLRKFEQS